MIPIISEPAVYIALTLVVANLLHALVHGGLAKALGIRLQEVSVFYFGRTHHNIGRGVLRVGWLPMGSYVAPVGIVSLDGESEPTAAQAYEYRSRPFWQRALFSLSGVASLTLGVVLCILLANPHQSFVANFMDWLTQMRLFFEYLAWQRAPSDFVNTLYHLSRRSLLLLTGASWLSINMFFALLPTGIVGRAVWRFLHIYDSRFGAAITLGLLIFSGGGWAYMLLMMLYMVIKVQTFPYLLIFVLNFLITSCLCALIVRWIAQKIGKNALQTAPPTV